MNDELHKLMEQAKEYASQNATGDWEVGPSYQDIFNKKFAELIVRECAWFMKINTKVNDDGQGAWRCARSAYDDGQGAWRCARSAYDDGYGAWRCARSAAYA